MKTALLVILAAAATAASAATEEHVIFGRPTGGYPLTHVGYVSGYKSKLGTSVWVSYHLKPGYFADDVAPAAEQKLYVEAVLADKGLRSPPVDDIASSGLPPLFFFPAADAQGRDAECRREVNSLVNVAPAKGPDVLRLWGELDEKVHGWTREFGEVWVMAGPIFDSEPERTRSGRTAIPSAFYMIVVRKEDDAVKTVAFKIPQDGAGELKNMLCTIDSIEQDTEIDFLSELPDDVENTVESAASTMWADALPPKPAAPAEKSPSAPVATAGAGKTNEPPKEAVSDVPKGPAIKPTPGKVWVRRAAGLYFTADSPSYGSGEGMEMDEFEAQALGFKQMTK